MKREKRPNQPTLSLPSSCFPFPRPLCERGPLILTHPHTHTRSCTHTHTRSCTHTHTHASTHTREHPLTHTPQITDPFSSESQ
ncbi:hypothetical protein IE53DRAFT_141342 [Violaceomyces palustris]|uniref:Uncharacterized protein n=1 Tax=Violaceomyces palustris TaxID=1673888 RepID=A0ACD0NUN9_9BASI|nr:hypothetical protein IE53DRAFT_141342 [Violaceomyces palustris]